MIRTWDPQIRNLVLYPTELPGPDAYAVSDFLQQALFERLPTGCNLTPTARKNASRASIAPTLLNSDKLTGQTEIEGRTHMGQVRIRDARPTDAAVIVDFNARMATETEGRTLDPELIGPGVAAVLADAARGRYWVAEADGEIVAQLMVTYEWSDWRNGFFWWIQSVYVRSDFRRKGVFSALHRHVEALARAAPDACGLRLYVEHENRRAQQTYLALGMSAPGYEVMEVDFRKGT